MTPVLLRTSHFIRPRRELLRLVAHEARLQVPYLPLDLLQPIQSVAKTKRWNVCEPPRVDEEVEEHDAREAGEGHIGHPQWGIRLQKAPAPMTPAKTPATTYTPKRRHQPAIARLLHHARVDRQPGAMGHP